MKPNTQSKNKLNKLQKDALYKVRGCEEDVVKKVLALYLGVEPKKSDGLLCIRAFEKGVTDRYTLIYDGIRLGDVITEIKAKNVSVKFEPHG